MADSTSYKDWVDRAEQDLRLLRTLNKNGFEGMEDAVCYNCQQAIEKLLKAYLLMKSNRLLKTHDLVYLLGECTKIDKAFNEFFDSLTVLNQYAVAARYPGDFSGHRSIQEANDSFEYVEEFYTFIRTKVCNI